MVNTVTIKSKKVWLAFHSLPFFSIAKTNQFILSHFSMDLSRDEHTFFLQHVMQLACFNFDWSQSKNVRHCVNMCSMETSI